MNDIAFQQPVSSESPSGENVPPRDEPPPLGALDIVEAFTAMRHEWRGQTRESRALAEQVQAAAANLQSLESKLLACVAANRTDGAAETRQLALLIVETDHQLSRAVTAIVQWEENRRRREAADANAVERYFEGMGWLARGFARPLMTFIAEQRAAQDSGAEHPAVDGLNMVLARLRRMMHEHGLERVDVLGQPFDANTMHAIGTVASSDHLSGSVAEQLSPAYRWRGVLLRFADVRVAS